MVTRSCQLMVALCLVVSAYAQSNNAIRDLNANLANVAFLQQQGLTLEEARLLSDSAAVPGAEIPILEDVRDGPWHDGSYYFRYTSADGSQREEGGIPTAPCTMRVTGSYSYIAPNGDHIDMEYVADENGYKAFPTGTRPDLYTAPVRVPEPIFPVGYFDGIPCPGDENNQGGQSPAAGSSPARPGFGNNRPVRPVSPPRPAPGAGTQGRPVSNQGRPTSTAQGRPSTGGQGRPSSGTLGRPNTGTQGRPNTGTLGRPSTGTQGRPIPGTQGRPISGSQGRPNIGSRPTPSYGGRPSIGGQARPTTSSQGRPNIFGQRPTSQRPNQGSYGQRQPNPSQGLTTPDGGYKTPTSLITAASTNVNVQNNYNTGVTTTNDGYSYTEPSRTFNFNQQTNENTVTTDFSVGPQTTPIEPLTQLYESPNF